MIKTKVSRVRPDKVDQLKAWLAEGMRRSDEIRETFVAEGVTHEQGFLLSTADGPVFVYVVECADYDAAVRAFHDSPFPIDAEHKAVLAEVLDGELDVPLLIDVRL
ncbi:DUF6176 family protein [Micromonospora krabiensis]|uniref:Quinol monooxygenase YgiN n=1 Tax=Micromonospora krabiensis TaxID=307121 RepID=A0A1C3NE74_9ACTN|nr:DUF6176 family protein [Micromonospora krabiensis]SBV30851.1 hypothetical protein GA0070620_6454 [Micromonospora krabiensis]